MTCRERPPTEATDERPSDDPVRSLAHDPAFPCCRFLEPRPQDAGDRLHRSRGRPGARHALRALRAFPWRRSRVARTAAGYPRRIEPRSATSYGVAMAVGFRSSRILMPELLDKLSHPGVEYEHVHQYRQAD